MADPIQNTTDTTATAVTVIDPQPVTPPAAPAAPAPKMFSQEEVDSMIKARLARVERAPVPASKPEPAKPNQASNEASFTREEWERESDRREEFARATASLDVKQVQFLRGAMKAANPADVTSWCEEAKSTMGLGKPPAPPVVQNVTVPTPVVTQAPTPPAAPQAPSGPVNPITEGAFVNLFGLTPPQLAQLGPSGVRAELDKIRAFSHQASGLARLPKVPERK